MTTPKLFEIDPLTPPDTWKHCLISTWSAPLMHVSFYPRPDKDIREEAALFLALHGVRQGHNFSLYSWECCPVECEIPLNAPDDWTPPPRGVPALVQAARLFEPGSKGLQILQTAIDRGRQPTRGASP